METTKSYGHITHGNDYIRNYKTHKRKLTKDQIEKLKAEKERLKKLLAEAETKGKIKRYKGELALVLKALRYGRI